MITAALRKKILSCSIENSAEFSHMLPQTSSELEMYIKMNNTFQDIATQALEEFVDRLLKRDEFKTLGGTNYKYPVTTVLQNIRYLLSMPEITKDNKLIQSHRLSAKMSDIKALVSRIGKEHRDEESLKSAEEEWESLRKCLVLGKETSALRDSAVCDDTPSEAAPVTHVEGAEYLVNTYIEALKGKLGGFKPNRLAILVRCAWLSKHMDNPKVFGQVGACFLDQKARRFGRNKDKISNALLILSHRYMGEQFFMKVQHVQPESLKKHLTVLGRELTAYSARKAAELAKQGLKSGGELLKQGASVATEWTAWGFSKIADAVFGNGVNSNNDSTDATNANGDTSSSTQRSNTGESFTAADADTVHDAGKHSVHDESETKSPPPQTNKGNTNKSPDSTPESATLATTTSKTPTDATTDKHSNDETTEKNSNRTGPTTDESSSKQNDTSADSSSESKKKGATTESKNNDGLRKADKKSKKKKASKKKKKK